MRVVLGFVLALCVGVGACFGSAQAANSAKANGRTVTLKLGNVAVLGRLQCRVTSHSPRFPGEYAGLQCSNGPLSKAAYSFINSGACLPTSNGHCKPTTGIDVFQKGVPAPIYATPGTEAARLVANSGRWPTRIVRLRVGDVATLPYGHAPIRAQCRAIAHASLRCSSGPLSKATYYAGITAAGINVYKKGSSAPIYSTPPAATSG